MTMSSPPCLVAIQSVKVPPRSMLIRSGGFIFEGMVNNQWHTAMPTMRQDRNKVDGKGSTQ